MSRHELGKWSVNFRMERDILLQDMAQTLGVTPSYISGVEHGRKGIPEDWYDKILASYDVDLVERTSLKIAIMRSKKRATVKVENEGQARVLVAYEKGREALTEEAVMQIEGILTSTENSGGSDDQNKQPDP